jgi:2-oxoglutarate ferredoxin oxidoreductase subunit alpha
MIDDAALAIKKTHKDRNIPAYALTYVYNTPPICKIKEDYFKVKSGEIKEVY